MKSVVVVGEGLSAAVAVWGCLRKGLPVHWVSPHAVSALPVLGTIEQGVGAEVALGLAEALGFDGLRLAPGNYLREFKNKSFRTPGWSREQDPVERQKVGQSQLWPGEGWLGGFNEVDLGVPFSAILERLRAELNHAEQNSSLWRRVGVPIQSFVIEQGYITGVLLASGDLLPCDQVFYADRFSPLAQIQGVPKSTAWLRRRHPIGLLQAAFTHARPWLQAAGQGFFTLIHRESGEEHDRHVWGHFSADGTQSYWTIAVTPEEGEDNAQLGKRLRRMKAALEKMFSGAEWASVEEGGFIGSLRDERVRYVEEGSSQGGEPRTHGWRLHGIEGFVALSDAFGVEPALATLGEVLGLPRSQGERAHTSGIRVGVDVQSLLEQGASMPESSA